MRDVLMMLLTMGVIFVAGIGAGNVVEQICAWQERNDEHRQN